MPLCDMLHPCTRKFAPAETYSQIGAPEPQAPSASATTLIKFTQDAEPINTQFKKLLLKYNLKEHSVKDIGHATFKMTDSLVDAMHDTIKGVFDGQLQPL